LQNIVKSFLAVFLWYEPGNDGNRKFQDMIDSNRFRARQLQLVESSEAGMLSTGEPKRSSAIMDRTFLGGPPHPMNAKTLNGLPFLVADDYLRPRPFGRANVHTNIRKGYVQECPKCWQYC